MTDTHFPLLLDILQKTVHNLMHDVIDPSWPPNFHIFKLSELTCLESDLKNSFTNGKTLPNITCI